MGSRSRIVLLGVLVHCGARTELNTDAGDVDAGIAGDGAGDAVADTQPEGSVGEAATDVEVDVGLAECTSNCVTDVECQTTCPVLSSGTYCCDVPTGVCFAFSALSCAPQVTDAGFD
jgi:hypothetical protein